MNTGWQPRSAAQAGEKRAAPSRLEIRQEIKKLNRLDPKRALYSAISTTYHNITSGLAIVVGKAGGGEIFHRVRRTAGSKPSRVSELRAPPAQVVTGYQRCNPPGVPMFYAASRRVGAIIESRAQAGEVVYLGEWIGRNQIPVNKIFDTEASQAIPGVDMSTIHGPNDDIILTYLDTLFTKRIYETFADDYKFTAAIAQQLTSNFQPNDFHDVHDDGFVALKYPSVLGLENSHNTAMHARFAVERLDLLHAMELRIISVDDSDVEVEVLDTATAFDDEKIIWSGDPSRVPTLLNQERDVPFIFDGTKWNREICGGPVTPDYLRLLIAD